MADYPLGRALEAPQIRRIFSCSPRDPRYHMLEHLSPKFKMPPVEREPRAALIVNRFTRTLSIMFATEAVSSILGVPASQVQGKSFYECIQESSLDDAFNCLESAKANDSIAYLRFWSRDPRRLEDFEAEESEEEEYDDEEEEEQNGQEGGLDAIDGRDGTRTDRESPYIKQQTLSPSRRSSDSEGGGVKLENNMDVDWESRRSPQVKNEPDVEMQDGQPCASDSAFDSRTASSAAFTSSAGVSRGYATPATVPSSRPTNQSTPRPRLQNGKRRRLVPSVELEAVVSCTSDGLVVVLRRARPRIPDLHPPLLPLGAGNGLFAAPWAQRPIQPQFSPETIYTFRPPFMPHHMPLRENVRAAGGPPLDQLMNSIRDVAVFAWALVGINGNIASYGRGMPAGEAQPPDGLPIWDPEAGHSHYTAPENQAAQRWARMEEQRRAQQQNGHFSTAPSNGRGTSIDMLSGGNENYSFERRNQWLAGLHNQQSSPSRNNHGFEQRQTNVLPSPWRRDQQQLGTVPLAAASGWNDTYDRDAGDYHLPSPTKDGVRDYPYTWRS